MDRSRTAFLALTWCLDIYKLRPEGWTGEEAEVVLKLKTGTVKPAFAMTTKALTILHVDMDASYGCFRSSPGMPVQGDPYMACDSASLHTLDRGGLPEVHSERERRR